MKSPRYLLIFLCFSPLLLYWKKSILHPANSIATETLLAILIFLISIFRLNSYIGFREICQKVQTIAHGYNIEKYYFYKFRSGENMDTLLKTEIFLLDLSDKNFFSSKQKIMLFIMKKDVKMEEKLEKIIKNKKYYPSGDYNIIIS